jgi:hypothetical protein
VVDRQLEAGRTAARGPRTKARPLDGVHTRRDHAGHRRQDGTVALWDVKTQNPIGPPLPIEPDTYVAADLSPDGARLFAASLSRRAIRWDIAPNAWKQRACRVAGRELTQQEWADALPGRSYRAVCQPG